MDLAEFTSLFNERLKNRGLDLRKLSEATGIATQHLEHLRAGNFNELPPAPYVRGYLERLGPVLGIDPAEWWSELKHSGLVQDAGHADELPKNRFAMEPVGKFVGGAIVIAIIIVYLVLRLPAVSGMPSLSVLEPPSGITRASASVLMVRGSVARGDTVRVNGENVRIGDDGSWRAEVSLAPGLNTIEIIAKKFLGRETKIVRQVLYEPVSSPPSEAETSAPLNTRGP